MICPKCKKEFESNAKFCDVCGTKLCEKCEPTLEVEQKREVDNVIVNEKETIPVKKSKGKAGKYVVMFLVLSLLSGTTTGVYKYVQDLKNSKDVAKEFSKNEKKEDLQIQKTDKEETQEYNSSSSVKKIEEMCENISEGIRNNKYQFRMINGDEFYSENNQLVLVIEEYNEGNRVFFAKDNKLIAVKYEDEICRDFYFENNKLVCWIEGDGKANSKNQIIHENESSEEFLEYESRSLDAWEIAKEIWEVETGKDSEYILPESNTRIISRSELEQLTKEEIKLARNEIYARHGRKFRDESLQAYFNQCSWYCPIIEPDDFSETMLNSYEIQNRDYMVEYEKEKGYR